MALQFAVDSWAALASGLSTQQQWLEWFRDPRPLARDFIPELAWMPASLRRRVSPLGRTALSVLSTCQLTDLGPVVFASRYGDLEGIAELLTQLDREGVVSPMGFSLAVHNAAMGVNSIARKDRTTTTCIAVNEDMAEAACFEALGWLGDGVGHVLMVCCGDPVPPPYEPTQGSEQFRYAWACRLRAVSSGGFSLLATIAGQASSPINPATPACLRALSFLVGAHPGEDLLSESGRYLWRRHA
jgi:hypothetical protein